MKPKVLAATPQTIAAIRKVARIPIYANNRGGGVANVGGAGSSEYNGCFKIETEVTEDGVLCYLVNGAIPDYEYCGFFYHGWQIIPVPNPEPILLPSSMGTGVYAWMVLVVEYDADLDEFTFEFAQQSSFELTSTSYSMPPVLLARVKTEEFISTIEQLHYGNIFSPGGLA